MQQATYRRFGFAHGLNGFSHGSPLDVSQPDRLTLIFGQSCQGDLESHNCLMTRYGSTGRSLLIREKVDQIEIRIGRAICAWLKAIPAATSFLPRRSSERLKIAGLPISQKRDKGGSM